MEKKADAVVRNVYDRVGKNLLPLFTVLFAPQIFFSLDHTSEIFSGRQWNTAPKILPNSPALPTP